jgi:hypothetical protein
MIYCLKLCHSQMSSVRQLDEWSKNNSSTL